ncbi:RNA polymerase sigma factor [Micromonosporaceae bacterium Da 78-11]
MAQSSPPEERFNRLWQEHAAAVLRYARRRVADEQADEVVAETFVVARRRLDEVPAAALPWLFAVARRVGANVRRSDRRWDALRDRIADEAPRDGPAVGGDGPGDTGSGRAAQVLSALQRLPDDDRELLMLLAWDGLTRPEAAAALGCSRGALAVRLHRARHRLRAAMGHDGTAPTPAAGRRSASTAQGGLR